MKRWIVFQGDQCLTEGEREKFRRLVSESVRQDDLLFLSLTVASSSILVTDLLRFDVDVNVTNQRGETPLHWAARLADDAIPFLLQNGANVNAIDQRGDTPLHYAIEAGNYPALKLLIRAGANLSLHNSAGLSPLEIAVLEDESRCAKVLVKAGATVPNDLITELTYFQRTRMLRSLLKHAGKHVL